MKTIGKHIQLIGILLLTVFVGAAAGLYFDLPGRLERGASQRQSVGASSTLHAPNAPRSTTVSYSCPIHPDVTSAKPDNCPKCGMALVLASQAKAVHDQCGDSGQKHPGCCADKNVGRASSRTVHGASLPRGSSGRMPPEPAEKMSASQSGELRLPPGHPPVPGWTTDAPPENEPASTNTSTHSSH